MRDVKERFLEYVKVDTQSDHLSQTSPSTAKQFDLAGKLYEELLSLGLSDVFYDMTYCYVYGTLESNLEVDQTAPVLGFMAHMDTSPDFSGQNVNPQIIYNYDGKDIPFLNDPASALSPKDSPELLDYIGKTIIMGDGTTLLGADDKAGVAEIMSAIAYLIEHPEIHHGKIMVCFTCDEEIGAGVDHIDLKRFNPEFAYTVDGGVIGELEYENFNAASAVLTVYGKSYHPGYSKNKMVNAILVANEFIGLLPADEVPGHTEGYEGFFHLHDMAGNVEKTELHYLIREHDRDIYEARKTMFLRCADFINDKYGEGTCVAEIKDCYSNMKEKILPVFHLIDNAYKAMEMEGVTPKVVPIRGGTDGCQLSFMGIPCPNLCTGAHNFHGRYEYVCLESMYQIVNVLVNIIKLNVQ